MVWWERDYSMEKASLAGPNSHSVVVDTAAAAAVVVDGGTGTYHHHDRHNHLFLSLLLLLLLLLLHFLCRSYHNHLFHHHYCCLYVFLCFHHHLFPLEKSGANSKTIEEKTCLKFVLSQFTKIRNESVIKMRSWFLIKGVGLGGMTILSLRDCLSHEGINQEGDAGWERLENGFGFLVESPEASMEQILLFCQRVA